jgi:hypothetical protein
MDEARREALLGELQDAEFERRQLGDYIETLRSRLGIEPGLPGTMLQPVTFDDSDDDQRAS